MRPARCAPEMKADLGFAPFGLGGIVVAARADGGVIAAVNADD